MRSMRVLVYVAATLIGVVVGAWPLHGQATAPVAKPGEFQGEVISVAKDSFIITDSKSGSASVKVSGRTTYQVDNKKSNFSQAVRMGYSVKGSLAPDGTAAEVISKASKPATKAATATAASKMEQLQKLLQAADDEWQILRPKIEKIQSLQTKLDSLEKPISVKSLPPVPANNDKIQADLKAKREARTKLSEDLTTAQADLQRLVTVRQELVLFQLGILK